MQPAITVHNLGKRYAAYHSDRPQTIMEAALAGFRYLRPQAQFWALRSIEFSVAPGEMLGVIGKNGAGKSTLLQLLGGILRPDQGQVRARGRIGALLDLGSSFHPDLTGRENVYGSAVFAGLTRRQVAQRFEAIVEFAELSTFIDRPTRTYSTGMQMRLAFATAIHTDPQILLVDEFLSVGDLAFQTKCLDRIRQLKAEGCAIVLISHSVEQVQELCDQVLWLQQGEIRAYGSPEIVAGQYLSELRAETQRRTPTCAKSSANEQLQLHQNRFGSLEAEILQVQLLPGNRINAGDALQVQIDYGADQPIAAPIFGVTISNEAGQTYLDTNTLAMGIVTPIIQDRGQIVLDLARLDLPGGTYFIDVGIYQKDWQYAYDVHWHVYTLEVESAVNHQGSLNPPLRWKLLNTPTAQSIS